MRILMTENRVSFHFLQDGDIDPLTGMYGNMNLLEARSKGYLLSTDAMVSNIHFYFILNSILEFRA